MNDGTGLDFMRARYYSAKISRFVSADAVGIAGGVNLYSYTGNSPLKAVDPTGFAAVSVGGGYFDGFGGLGYVSYDLKTHQKCLTVEVGLGVGAWGVGGSIGSSPSAGWSGINFGWSLPVEPPLGVGGSIGIGRGESASIGGSLGVGVAITTGWTFCLPPPPPPPPPSPPGRPGYSNSSTSVRSADPNDKLAPAGFGDGTYIPSDRHPRPTRSASRTSRCHRPSAARSTSRTCSIRTSTSTRFELTEIAFADQPIAVPRRPRPLRGHAADHGERPADPRRGHGRRSTAPRGTLTLTSAPSTPPPAGSPKIPLSACSTPTTAPAAGRLRQLPRQPDRRPALRHVDREPRTASSSTSTTRSTPRWSTTPSTPPRRPARSTPLPATTTDPTLTALLVRPGRAGRLGDCLLHHLCLGRWSPTLRNCSRTRPRPPGPSQPSPAILMPSTRSPVTTSATSRTPPPRPTPRSPS